MQRVRQSVFDRARDALPVLGVDQPVRTICCKRPGADVSDAVRERVDVAVGVIRLLDLTREPIGRDRAFAHQETIERRGELGMSGGRGFWTSGATADVPQSLPPRPRAPAAAGLVVSRRGLQPQYFPADGGACGGILFLSVCVRR